jgi:hypothetical protein
MAPLASARFYAFEPVAKQLQLQEELVRRSLDGEDQTINRLCIIIGTIHMLHNP